MQEMLTRWGTATVWDLGSDPINSLALRRRVDSGEVRGPQILLTGNIFPKGGHPVYLPPQILLKVLPEIAARGCDELWLNPGAESEEVKYLVERRRIQ